jgi:2-dehydro-3-deoxygalactonokinase
MASDTPGAEEVAGFAAGLDEARRQAPLSQALFGVRARVVAGALELARARGFVSGLPVGAEFAELSALPGVPLGAALVIGSPALSERYARAAARFGVAHEALDAARVHCAALAQFHEGLTP